MTDLGSFWFVKTTVPGTTSRNKINIVKNNNINKRKNNNNNKSENDVHKISVDYFALIAAIFVPISVVIDGFKSPKQVWYFDKLSNKS